MDDFYTIATNFYIIHISGKGKYGRQIHTSLAGLGTRCFKTLPIFKNTEQY